MKSLSTTVVLVLATTVATRAHSGPPYPIITDRVVGSYLVSLWTDPDATDDGSAAGQFWVVLRHNSAQRDQPVRDVDVAVRPLDRPGGAAHGTAMPVDGDPLRRFVALPLDHEGRFAVQALVDGTTLDATVDATYDLRPPRAMILLYMMPFVLAGFLWIKLVWRRRGHSART